MNTNAFCDTDIQKHANKGYTENENYHEERVSDKSDIIIIIKDDEEIINKARKLYIEIKMDTYFEMYGDSDNETQLMYNLFSDIWDKYPNAAKPPTHKTTP